MGSLKPGDTYTACREGKVFLTQYHALGAFVSITRKLGDDPDAERVEMDGLADRLWREALLANHRNADAAYAALGTDGDVEKLIEYLERTTSGGAQEAAQAPVKLRKRKLGG